MTLQSILLLIANKDKLRCLANFLESPPRQRVSWSQVGAAASKKSSWATIPEFKNDWPRRSAKEESDENYSVERHMGSAPLGSVSYNSNKAVIFWP